MKLKQSQYHGEPGHLVYDEHGDFYACCGEPHEAEALVHRYNAHDAMYAALLAVQALFAREGFYIAKADCAEGIIGPADHEAIDATFVQVAAALRAAGEAK